ncbi:MAG: FAD-binding oxidoreductase [Actinomycetia bacterium]|nr:FAD-binding oxidoreductase [Actinomycetes bacterium]
MQASQVFWQLTPDPAPAPVAAEGPLPAATAVAVVGGGLTGLSAALTLAERAVPVLVLESGALADGASGRNGGQVLTGFNVGIRDLVRHLGPDTARELWRQSVAAVDRVAEWVERYRIPCDFVRHGNLQLADSPATLDDFAAEREALAAAGVPAELLDREETSRRLGSRFYVGALYDPLAGGINPYRFALGLAAAAQAAGAVLRAHTPVTAVEGRGPFVLHTPAGRVRAETVLLAANAFAGALDPFLARRIRRLEASIMATAPMPEALAARVLPGRETAFDNTARLRYFQRTADGRLVFGGRVHDAARRAAARQLSRALADVFPEARTLGAAYLWSGPIALSRDGLPHLGRTPSGLYYAAGYSGHGVALATWLGAQAAQWILAGTADWPPWTALAFPVWTADERRSAPALVAERP